MSDFESAQGFTSTQEYVAIHDGQVVDSDADEVALILRVQARVGYVPLNVPQGFAARAR
jgi:hypothetical protein